VQERIEDYQVDFGQPKSEKVTFLRQAERGTYESNSNSFSLESF
jgi:hypothetical protein